MSVFNLRSLNTGNSKGHRTVWMFPLNDTEYPTPYGYVRVSIPVNALHWTHCVVLLAPSSHHTLASWVLFRIENTMSIYKHRVCELEV